MRLLKKVAWASVSIPLCKLVFLQFPVFYHRKMQLPRLNTPLKKRMVKKVSVLLNLISKLLMKRWLVYIVFHSPQRSVACSILLLGLPMLHQTLLGVSLVKLLQVEAMPYQSVLCRLMVLFQQARLLLKNVIWLWKFRSGKPIYVLNVASV